MSVEQEVNLGGSLLDIGVFDLETTDLQGDFGRILSGAVWSLPDNVWSTFRADRYPGEFEDDEEIALDIRDCLESHDVLVGWYSKGFDIPFLNSRLAKFNNRLIDRHFHIDPIYYYRGWRGLKPRKSSLETVAEFLDIERKPSLDADVWVAARLSGEENAMDKVVDRNMADVRITKQAAEYAIKSGLCKNIQQYP